MSEKNAGRLSLTEYTAPITKPITPVAKDPKHLSASKRIDALLSNYWTEKGVTAEPIIDDSTYLRRTYLKVIGRIPTYAEAIHFLESEEPNKRSQLIDTLLDSQGYISHHFNLWADILRVKTTGQQGSRYGGVYYAAWLKDQIRENKPYDQFVKSLLTADGYPWENPAAAFYMRDFGMPLDNMAMSTQVFLGTQLQCAQCHDHPDDVWTQKDFYELSSFTYGLKTGINVPRDTPEYRSLYQELNKRARQANGGKRPSFQSASQLSAGRELLSPLRWKVEHTNRPLQLPHDYQYDDASPKDTVDPHVLFGEMPEVNLNDSSARVEAYGNWVTSPENPRFTLVIANRIWKQTMGKGIIEPVDNMTNETVPEAPELMAYLVELMHMLDYDIKQFQRVLLNTQYFQRQSVIDNPDLADDYHFEGPTFERMTSEQIWDSLATLMSPDIDQILLPSYTANDRGIRYNSDQAPGIMGEIDSWSKQDILDYIEKLTLAYKAYQAARSEFAELRTAGTPSNSSEFKAARDKEREAGKTWRELLNGAKEQQAPTSDVSMMMASVTPIQNKQARRQSERWLRNIRRASELQSPMRNGHLLEVFGQSDRMLIENSDDSGNVLQALFLMNSPQTNQMLANRSAPVLEARMAKTPEEKLSTLYVGFLARQPTTAETEALLPYFVEEPEKARQRIIWAMLNTQQFLFIQ